MMSHKQIGLIVVLFCFTGIILSGLSQDLESMLGFIISMMITGFAILAYTLSKGNKVTQQSFSSVKEIEN